jgi:amidohydrolase
MEEDTNLSFRSQNPGVMHSCGHDGHIAILLATGRHLAQHRDSFCGTVFLCFQQAEEIGEGHAPVIAYLKAMGGVSTVLSSHLWVDIPVGKISLRSGPVMAGTTAFRIKITGAGCHGSRPDQGIDPINAGVTLVGNVMRLKDREISPLQSNTLSFGLFHSGSATNIIPAEADLGGTMRFFSSEEKSHLLSLVERGCKATELLTRCKVACTIGVGLPPVVNWTECMPAVQSAAGKVFGTENIIEYDRIMASDNFGFYLQEFPGLYAFIGIGNKSKRACCAHHNPKFDLDEDALKLAVSFYLTYITENMGGK